MNCRHSVESCCTENLEKQLDSIAAVSLIPRLSPQNGGRREPGNIHRKSCWLLACHHSCDQRRTLPLYKLSCNIGTVSGSSTNYLQFRSLSSRHPQLCWVPWRTLYITKYDERVSPTSQLQQTLIFDSLDSRLFCTSENCFSPTFDV